MIGRTRPAQRTGAGGGAGQNLATSAVPWPGTEYRSQKSASRRMAPSPMPRVPLVEWPSRSAAPVSRRPGPASMVTSSIPGLPPCRAMRSSIDPWPACLSRLDAASVTASASWSARASGNPSRAASATAAPRQAAAALGSSTRSQRRSPGAWAASGRFNVTT